MNLVSRLREKVSFPSGWPVRCPARMLGRAAPRPVERGAAQPGPNRIELDIPHAPEQMRLVHGKRGKPRLPEMPAPALAHVDKAGVAPVGFGEGPRKAGLVRRHGNDVNMVRHQAICPDLSLRPLAPSREEIKLRAIVIIGEESSLTPVAALRDVMRHVRNDKSCMSRADRLLTRSLCDRLGSRESAPSH